MCEMRQFHDRNVVCPFSLEDKTPYIKMKALGYLIFLKEKRSSDIKGRRYVDGRPQQLYKSKIDMSSPTPATKSIFITGL